jgi:hypothetical protein
MDTTKDNHMNMMHFIAAGVISAISLNATSATKVAQFSDQTGGVNVNTTAQTAYTFDTTDIASEMYTLNDSRIELNQDGLYQISYSLSWGTTDINRREIKTAVRLNGTTVIGGSSYGYARRMDEAGDASNNSTFYLEAHEGDYIELTHQRNSSITTNAFSNAGESWISLEQVENIAPDEDDPVPLGQHLTLATPLTASAITASNTYYLDVPASAFDGWGYNTSSATYGNGHGLTNGVKQARGLFNTTWSCNPNALNNQWIMVNFQNPVVLTQADFYTRPGYAVYSVRDVSVEISTDNGVTFSVHDSIAGQQSDHVVFQFSNQTPSITNVRFRMNGNPNGQCDIEINDIVLFGQEML